MNLIFLEPFKLYQTRDGKPAYVLSDSETAATGPLEFPLHVVTPDGDYLVTRLGRTSLTETSPRDVTNFWPQMVGRSAGLAMIRSQPGPAKLLEQAERRFVELGGSFSPPARRETPLEEGRWYITSTGVTFYVILQWRDSRVYSVVGACWDGWDLIGETGSGAWGGYVTHELPHSVVAGTDIQHHVLLRIRGTFSDGLSQVYWNEAALGPVPDDLRSSVRLTRAESREAYEADKARIEGEHEQATKLALNTPAANWEVGQWVRCERVSGRIESITTNDSGLSLITANMRDRYAHTQIFHLNGQRVREGARLEVMTRDLFLRGRHSAWTVGEDGGETMYQFECSCCNELFDTDEDGMDYDPSSPDTFEMVDGDPVCRGCLEEHYVTLHDGSYCSRDEAIWIESEDEYYHEDDQRICSAVHNSRGHEQYYRTAHCTQHNGVWYEDTYFNENFSHCDSCECTMHAEDSYYDDDEEACLCLSCYEEAARNRRNNVVKAYNEDVLRYLSFGPLAKGERYTFGVELEVEDCSDIPGLAEELEGEAILKHDGSLSDDGVEIVTRPMGMTAMKAVFNKDFLQWVVDNGGRSFNTDTCGLHVHVGRKQLTKAQIGKVVCFMHNPDNREFIRAIAQRDVERWAKISPAKRFCPRDAHSSDDRYTAVNLNNSGTIEFRIFKGTLAFSGVHRALDFVQAMLDYASPCQTSVSAFLPWQNFIDFVRVGHKAYPELTSWLVAKEYLKAGDKGKLLLKHERVAAALPKGREKPKREPTISEVNVDTYALDSVVSYTHDGAIESAAVAAYRGQASAGWPISSGQASVNNVQAGAVQAQMEAYARAVAQSQRAISLGLANQVAGAQEVGTESEQVHNLAIEIADAIARRENDTLVFMAPREFRVSWREDATRDHLVIDLRQYDGDSYGFSVPTRARLYQREFTRELVEVVEHALRRLLAQSMLPLTVRFVASNSPVDYAVYERRTVARGQQETLQAHDEALISASPTGRTRRFTF